ncbi:MAG: Protein YhgF [Myxococcota bacterium]|nr:Protein YhgF [Myxococcota bacterium]
MPENLNFNPAPPVAAELSLPLSGVEAVLRLLGDGNTVPFIARYRKEATGALDEVQIRSIEERGQYMRELEERRLAVLKSIDEQGKLTGALRQRILDAKTKTAVEDLYLPYKPRKRTRATVARDRGLEPLAQLILSQAGEGDPAAAAEAYINAEKEVPNAEAALAGARDIVAEVISDNADIRAFVREHFKTQGVIAAGRNPERADDKSKYKEYFNFREAVASIPSHRYLAVRRGENEKHLKVHVEVDAEALIRRILETLGHQASSPFGAQLELAAQDAWRRLIAPSVENDVRVEIKVRSDNEAVQVFASNLRNILLAPPYGAKAVCGVDPGIRTGCKCVAVSPTGRYLDAITLFLAQGDEARAKSAQDLVEFVRRHQSTAIAVGNGTHGRETEAFVRKALGDAGLAEVLVIPVSETGASVYSASDLAREEFPGLDVTMRGAISIARRLQDPLAELVKIDPKSLGVGQYQHDVHQPLLKKKLTEVVESCVNAVGVELNTASAALLGYVSGIGPALAQKIVEHRNRIEKFQSRFDLLQVEGLGPRTFEQAAGFLRIRHAANPLDNSAVHPERYPLIERIAQDLGVDLSRLIGAQEEIAKVEIARYASDEVGELTLRDIIEELKKPGRDPRADFDPPRFKEGVYDIKDLQVGMEMEGIVSNVTAFGAFVDIGVHQDGLVHVSHLSRRFIREPGEAVKTGDKIKVWVIEVDLERKRIGLSAINPAEARERPARAPRGEAGDARRRERPQGERRSRRGPHPDPQQPSAGEAPAPAGQAAQPDQPRAEQSREHREHRPPRRADGDRRQGPRPGRQESGRQETRPGGEQRPQGERREDRPRRDDQNRAAQGRDQRGDRPREDRRSQRDDRRGQRDRDKRGGDRPSSNRPLTFNPFAALLNK